VTGLLLPTVWGVGLLAEGRLGQYVRACWAREHATTTQPEPPAAGPRTEWAQSTLDWASLASDLTAPGPDWPSDGTDWASASPAAGYFASGPDWPAAGTEWGAASDWSPPVPYAAPDAERLIVEQVWPGRTVDDWPGSQPGR
jgi:hypothetical protein